MTLVELHGGEWSPRWSVLIAILDPGPGRDHEPAAGREPRRGQPAGAAGADELMDQLHSACVAPGVAPVLAGSTESSLSFLSRRGSAVSPTPDKRVVTPQRRAPSRESIYPATGGAAPSWTFAGTPSSTRELLTGVERRLRPATRRPACRSSGTSPTCGGAASPTTPLADPAERRRRGQDGPGHGRVRVVARERPATDARGRRSPSPTRPPSASSPRARTDGGEPAMRLKRLAAERCARTRAVRDDRRRRRDRVVTILVGGRRWPRPTATSPDPARPRPQARLRGGPGRDRRLLLPPQQRHRLLGQVHLGADAQRRQPEGSTAKRRSVPGSTDASYAIELIPATGQTRLQHREPGRRRCSSRAARTPARSASARPATRANDRSSRSSPPSSARASSTTSTSPSSRPPTRSPTVRTRRRARRRLRAVHASSVARAATSQPIPDSGGQYCDMIVVRHRRRHRRARCTPTTRC